MHVLKRIYLLLSVIMLSALLGLAVVCGFYNHRFNDTSNWVRHTILVIDRIQSVLTQLHECENGRSKTLRSSLDTLGQMTADNALQHRRSDSLLYYKTAFPSDSTLPIIAVPYFDNMRTLLLRMQGEEIQLLDMREAVNSAVRKNLWANILILVVAIFLLLLASCILVFYQISKRVRAENKWKESEQRFSLLVHKEKNYAIFMLDTDGCVTSWNEGARQIKGYTEAEILGQPFTVFYTEEDQEQNIPAQNLHTTAQNEHLETVGLRKRKDGSSFWADVVFTAVRDERGNLTGYIKITKDITAQKNSEEEIQRLLARERELNEMKSRFVAIASHEFKTPLAVILSSTSLIDKYDAPEMKDKRHHHVERIKSNVGNLRQILDDFLSIEKLEQGIIRNKPASEDLVRLCSNIISDLEPYCKPGQQIRFSVTGRPVIALLDAQLLRNILNNLLSNAIKYSPVESTIQFIVEFQQHSVRFVIADSGIGIPEDEMGHLFESFFRARNTTGISGTGLGLNIVKRYLDLMGGFIELQSRVGEGSTFSATIPIQPVAGILR